MEYIQHEWEKIGVRCEVQVAQSASFRELTAKAQVQLFRKSWLADYADAENFLSLFYTKNFCPSGPNYTHFSDSRFDTLYEEAFTQPDRLRRNALVAQMDSLVDASRVVIPLYYDQVSHFVRKEITDFPTNAVNMLDLTRVRKNNP